MMRKIYVTVSAAMIAAGFHFGAGAEEFSRAEWLAQLKAGKDGRQLVAIRHLVKDGPLDAELGRALTGALTDDAGDVRRAAALGLERVGAPAKDSVPALVAIAKDKDSAVRAAVIAALGAVGPPGKDALPALIEALNDSIPQLRVAAVEALRRHGPALKDSIEARNALGAMGLKETHADVVNALVTCLAEMDPVPAELAPFFAVGLRGSVTARAKSVEALQKIGISSAPLLLPVLSSDFVYARRDAAALLETFLKDKVHGTELSTPELAHAMALALKDADSSVRKSAVAALSSMGRNALPALPEVLKRLAENDMFVRASAAGVIENLGVPVPEAVPPLLELLQDKFPSTRVAAAKALAKQGAGPALDGVMALLKSPRDEVRLAASASLALFGSVAEKGLAEALKSERSEIQISALTALEKMGGARAEALNELPNLLKSNSSSMRTLAGTALAKSGVHALPAMMAALATVERNSTPSLQNDFHHALVDTFGKIGARAVPALMTFIQEKPDDPARIAGRIVAREALGRMGPAAHEATNLLIAELTPVPAPPATPAAPVSKKAVQVAAVAGQPLLPARAREDIAALNALGGIGPSADAALPLLFEMLKDGEYYVRQEAARAISKIASGKERIPPLSEILERGDTSSLAVALRPFQEAGMLTLLMEFEPSNIQLRSKIGSIFANLPGSMSVPFLCEQLQNSSEAKVRSGAAYALGEMRQYDLRQGKRVTVPAHSASMEIALKALHSAISDPDPDVRVTAAYGCAKAVNPDDAEVISKIATALTKCIPENRVRGITALTYYNLAKHGRKAAPALGVLIRSPEYSNGGTVRAMVQQIGVTEEDIPTLVEALKDKDNHARRAAMRLLESLGADAVGAAPALVEALNDEEKAFTRSAEATLNAIGSEAVPFLIEAMKQVQPADGKGGGRRRLRAAQALAQMKLDGEWLQRVADLMVDDRAEVRAGAMLVLSAGSERAKFALPHLKQLLADDDRLVNRAGMDLVSMMGAAAVPELVLLSRDPRPQIRARVAAGLKPHGVVAPAPEVLTTLLALLKDDASEVKAAALISLASIPGNAAEIIKEMPAALRDESVQTRRAAVTYLRTHGQSAPKESIASLAILLLNKTADSRIKTMAIDALRTLGPDAAALRVKVLLEVEEKLGGAAGANENAAVNPADFNLPKAPVEPQLVAAEAPVARMREVEVSMESLLFAAIDDPERRVRAGAAEAIAQLRLDADPAKKILINQMFAFDAMELYAHAQEEYFIKAWDEQRVHYYAAALKDLVVLPSSLANAEKLPPRELAVKPVEEIKSSSKAPRAPAPYNGYWFKLLETQGANATGGAKKFIVEGRYYQGHALAAFPAEYGTSGRFVFLIGDDGTIYKKDLGDKTAAFGAEVTELNPDATWEKFKVKPKEEQVVRFQPQEPDSAQMEF